MAVPVLHSLSGIPAPGIQSCLLTAAQDRSTGGRKQSSSSTSNSLSSQRADEIAEELQARYEEIKAQSQCSTLVTLVFSIPREL